MKSISKFVGAVVAVFAGTCGVAFAAPQFVPEPGSLALVGIAVVGLIAANRKGRK